jgi:hypothetical protein
MNTSHVPGAQQSAPQPWQGKLLFLNGCFLVVAGSAAMGSELRAYFGGKGPLAAAFHHSPYTIGFVEAHGFAILTGLQLLRASRGWQKRFWHLSATLVHLLLGGSNLLFWRSFIHLRLLPVGITTTIMHGFFSVTQLLAFCSAPSTPSSDAAAEETRSALKGD